MRIIQPEAHIMPFTGDVLKHVERCGRIAYKSEDAIKEGSHIRFIQNIIKRGHESVLEHGNYVFEVEKDDFGFMLSHYEDVFFVHYEEKGYSRRLRFSKDTGRYIISGNIRAWRDFYRMLIDGRKRLPLCLAITFNENPAFYDLPGDSDGKLNTHGFKQLQREDLTPEEADIHWTETVHFICSRAISHELVRHRALSPTQESQRYCNYSKGKFGGEITFIEPLWAKDGAGGYSWERTMYYSEDFYMWLLETCEMQPQEAREVLPNSTKTELVMTGTLGEWKHFFSLRCADDAHPEMRRISIPLHEEFNAHCNF